jgi:hypothetical protein
MQPMRTVRVAMQKMIKPSGSARFRRLTHAFRRAYANGYVSLIRRQLHVLLLLPDAGVWVGTQRNSSHPPGKAGGFCFHPLLRAGNRGWAGFRNLASMKIYEGESYDYRNRK